MNNTPTPRTDEFISTLIIGTIDRNNGRIAWGTKDIETLVSHARQLERELTESQSWVRASMESTAIAASTIAGLESERDTLRKMLDAFAENGDCGDEWLMADYRELPHVRARKTK